MLIKRMMDGAMPGVPRLYFGGVDLREVAELHVRAMLDPAASGERFLAAAGDFMSMLDVANVLKRRMGTSAEKVPTRQLANWLVRLSAMFRPEVRQILPELGKRKNGSNEKARRMLGWAPRSNEEAIVATAKSLVQLGLLRDEPSKSPQNGSLRWSGQNVVSDVLTVFFRRATDTARLPKMSKTTASGRNRARILRQAILELHPLHFFRNPDVLGWRKGVAVVECRERDACSRRALSPGEQPRAANLAKDPVERFR